MTDFASPASISEAAELLAEGRWALLAGGTDLYASHVGRRIGQPVLDLSRVVGLRGIGRLGSGTAESSWTIGACTTWTDLLRADLPPLFDAMKAAARELGGVQIQNAGTVAGNVCNASPAADGIPVLLALGAVVRVASRRGERELLLKDFVLGSRRVALADDEFVVAIQVPARSDRARSTFVKLGSRRHLVISITMVAAMVDVDEDGRVVEAAVAVGSCSAVAQRLPALEARLVGQPVTGLAVCVEPADLAALTPIDDIRGSAAYRRDATLTLLRRALAAIAL